tara:strand:+ start:12639 stop:15632 length:2994 start_codon:yes stop_codon:yes gene_type:complete
MNNIIHLLYIEDNLQDADLTRMHFELEATDFQIEVVGTGEDCLKRLSEQSFDVLLLDKRLPDMDGLGVLCKLRANGHILPVVMVTGMGDEETVAESLRAGAADYVSKSETDYLIMLPNLLRQVVARQHRQCHGKDGEQRNQKILYIEPNTMDVELTEQHFASTVPHLKLQTINSSRDALTLLSGKHDIDLVLTDLRVPDMNALELIREIQFRGIDIPFIVITGRGDEATAVAILRLGAYDYIVKRKNYLMQLPHAIDHALHRFYLDQTTHRLNSELTELNASLERKIEERTAELKKEAIVRKAAELASSNRESQLKAVIESLTEGLAISDLDGRLLHFNQAALNIHGFTSSKEWLRLLPEFADNFQLSTMDGTVLSLDQWPLARILRGETLCGLALYIKHIQDSWQRIFSYGGTIAHDDAGKPLVAIVTISDITHSKQTESNLRIAAVSFESQESIMITDAELKILRVNKAFTKTTGYTAAEIVGQTPQLLKSDRHDAEFFREMWESINQTGTWQGEIWDKRKNREIYPKWLTITAVKDDNDVVTHYVVSHIDITERKLSQEKIQHLAFYDHLTDLPNRILLIDRLKQALASCSRNKRKGALLFIDLDNFKNLNDTLGHDVGDQLLIQATQRLESCVRECDTVARLGGDEFMVMLSDLSDQALEASAQTETLGEKILEALDQSYQLGSYSHHCTASIGVTLFQDLQQNTEELLKQADIAMYQAKKAGRNTLRFFDPNMQTIIDDRVTMEDELHKAIEKSQFQLYYQLQVDNLGHPLGAEALIRWWHTERGMVPPMEFIPLAEETGLILPIGKWVLETACAQIKAWQQDALTRGLAVAVNVSAKQFHQPSFVDHVQAAIEHYAIKPELLKLELTEGVLLANVEETIAIMNALKNVGVQFSLDDFGTGYSSLQYLKRLPLNQLKIDQSFIRDIVTDSNDRAIVRTIIAMAQSMGLDIIAEGVETEPQRQLLLKKGCANFQGYLFAKPLPIEQFEALLKK